MGTLTTTEQCHIMLPSIRAATTDCMHSQDGECKFKILLATKAIRELNESGLYPQLLKIVQEVMIEAEANKKEH